MTCPRPGEARAARNAEILRVGGGAEENPSGPALSNGRPARRRPTLPHPVRQGAPESAAARAVKCVPCKRHHRICRPQPKADLSHTALDCARGGPKFMLCHLVVVRRASEVKPSFRARSPAPLPVTRPAIRGDAKDFPMRHGRPNASVACLRPRGGDGESSVAH
jgi:hypothetical protein